MSLMPEIVDPTPGVRGGAVGRTGVRLSLVPREKIEPASKYYDAFAGCIFTHKCDFWPQYFTTTPRGRLEVNSGSIYTPKTPGTSVLDPKYTLNHDYESGLPRYVGLKAQLQLRHYV